jgi:hypothetical protein
MFEKRALLVGWLVDSDSREWTREISSGLLEMMMMVVVVVVVDDFLVF